jgi:hypothetical protein
MFSIFQSLTPRSEFLLRLVFFVPLPLFTQLNSDGGITMVRFRSVSVIGVLFLIALAVAAWTTPVQGSEKGKHQ